MAATALSINGMNFLATTIQTDVGLAIKMYKADKDFKPDGDPEEFADVDRTEEEWHVSIREDAIKQDHFVPQYSTNPEWSPEKKEIETIEDTYLKNICGLGKGEGCCAFLAAGSKGFECLKGGSLEHTIRERLAIEDMNAKGDNCNGYNLRDKTNDSTEST